MIFLRAVRMHRRAFKCDLIDLILYFLYNSATVILYNAYHFNKHYVLFYVLHSTPIKIIGINIITYYVNSL